MTGRPVYGLLGFRWAPDGKVFAAVAPSRHGLLSGAEAIEIPCDAKIAEASGELQERWARSELARQGKAFHGAYISDLPSGHF